MGSVTLRVSLDERREATLVTGQELVAPSFRLVLLRNILDMRLQLAGERGPDGDNVLLSQQGGEISIVTLERVAGHSLSLEHGRARFLGQRNLVQLSLG